ncbi:MAG: PcfJ domain-containing protein [Thiothrix sp.]|uniref:PcfJ domain-containing protein n=1 Tax=Thiothrix sp. TaxID=1032 RepID=UPI002617234B|nr:PcfJ domain-containing protein [Thiothrix sp.]MDD5395624.1 PcfJ domain-containing protein [Thiothrix sp.]
MKIEPAPVLALGLAARNAKPPSFLPSWQRDEAKLRLVLLCEWLDDKLDKPAKVSRVSKNVRRITIFEGLAYTVNSEKRSVISGTIRNKCYKENRYNFEIGRPLFTSWWLNSVLKNLNLIDHEQGELFFDDSQINGVEKWLADTAYRLLLKNPKFQAFRCLGLPKLFKFPSDIYWIALASRTNPVGPLMGSPTLNRVWRNDRTFRQVAKENTQLLPLLMAFVEQIPAGTKNYKDPVLAVKTVFLDAGLSEAAWRYVVRHGSRIFRIPWEEAVGQPRLEVAIRYLKALEAAGLPPPPPPTVAKAFLHSYNPHQRHDAQIGEHFESIIDPIVLRAGLLEADRRRSEGEVEGFSEEFLGVCWWSESLANSLDDNQIKAGWPWFVRQWRTTETEHAMLSKAKQLYWQPRLEAFDMGRMKVVPLKSSEELILESLAMRNCLETYAEKCASGKAEVYSIRDLHTGKRKGCVGLRVDNDKPYIIDVKGFANTPPSGEVQQIANELARRLQGMYPNMCTKRS